MAAQGVPLFMRACVIKAYDGKLESLAVMKRPVPRPGNDEVLVKMTAAPVNQSDLLFLRGRYSHHRPLPAIPGMEGSGVVVDSGGVLGQLLLGRRVACMATSDSGTWAEYAVANVSQCIPLRRHISDEQGALAFVVPLTAWALVQSLRKGRHRAGAQTAAASSLGQIVLRLAQREGISMINIVRRPEQVELLRSLGAEYVLNSSDADFDERCRALCHELRVTLAFDAVAGDTTARLLRALPRGAKVTVFGALSQQPAQVDPDQLIFEHKELDGFWLADWFPSGFGGGQSPLSQLTGLLDQENAAHINATFSLEQLHDAVKAVSKGIGGGKVLLVP